MFRFTILVPFLIELSFLGTSSRAMEKTDNPSPVPLGEKRQLFIDDYVIQKMDNLKKCLHEPQDYSSNPVLSPEEPWEHRRIIYGSVYFIPEENKFKCWYLAANIYDSRPGFRGYNSTRPVPLPESAFICYAESRDGIHWKRPNLGIHEYRGSKKNNIVLVHRGSHFDSTSLVYTPWDEEKPYKIMVFQGRWPYQEDLIKKQWGPDFKFGIDVHGHYAWYSKDGIHFQPYKKDEPVFRAGDRTMCWYDPDAKLYVTSGKSSYHGKRAQRYVKSKDFVHWDMTNTWMMHADEKDHPRDESEACYGFKYGGQYVGYVEMRRIRKDETRLDWELMVSRDGRRWSRPFRSPFLPTGPRESWRYQVMKVFANPPIRRDDQLWIYYSGKTGTNDPYSGTSPNQALNLARLRLDGFVSVDGGPDGGVLVTKPMLLKNRHLHLNADASNGEIRVEITDSEGKPIPGWSADLCLPIRGDHVDCTVSWKDKESRIPLQKEPVCLVIHLNNASLYSLWTENLVNDADTKIPTASQ